MKKKKVGFTSSIGFILAAAGSAIGLGNLWAFPYKTAVNGGAAFVFVYIACVLLIGFVTMLSEIHIGKRAHANPITAYKMVNKNLGWFGLIAILIPFFITCYYSVLGGYTIKYTLHSFRGNSGILSTFSVNSGEVTLYSGVFILLAILIIMCGVKEGIEKISKTLMPTLFLILVGIVIYSLTLGEGVKEGLAFYLNPDFKSLGLSGVLGAMGQAFFSLSLGMGIMITYGSYTGGEINIVKSTAMICLFDTLVALLAGLAIFPAVAHFDPDLLQSSQGIALIFAILPDVFKSMGFAGNIVSFLFFAMVAIAALTSVMSLIEVVTQFIIQKFKITRKISALIVALICFAVSIPVGISLGKVAIAEGEGPTLFGLDWLTFFDEVTNTVLMPVGALLACISVGWIIQPKKAIQEMEEHGTRKKIHPVLAAIYSVMVRYITPALIIIIEVFGIKSKFDAKQEAVVYCAYGLIVLCVLIYFIFFRHTQTGCNDDEILIEQRKKEKKASTVEP
ncbi:MAG: sodium-dependent transporter [Clostridia bacterium]|nr:sodium-dependent transporter [Clostridia bacterium]